MFNAQTAHAVDWAASSSSSGTLRRGQGPGGPARRFTKEINSLRYKTQYNRGLPASLPPTPHYTIAGASMPYKHIKTPPGGEKIRVNKDFSLSVPDNPIIPYIEGDG